MDWNSFTGTCASMCPKAEIKMREKEGLLHKFEMKEGTESQKRPKADPDKVIKQYSRPAAGQIINNPTDTRPFPILIKTIEYLNREIFPNHRQKPVMVYNFMFDRFRSIRQDMVVQNLNPGQCIAVLEPIIRFHAYFGYLLLNERIDDYDPHINNTHLQECLKRLLVCYDFVNSCKSDFKNYVKEFKWNDLLKNQFEMESIYLLFNLGDSNALARGANIFIKNDSFKNCFLLSISWYLKNYVKVFNYIRPLPVLLLCVVAMHIPYIRHYALRIMSNAYSSNNCEYPISNLKNLLLYDSESEAVDDCQYYNVRVENGNIKYLKKDFNLSVLPKKGKRLKFIDGKLSKCNLNNLLENKIV